MNVIIAIIAIVWGVLNIVLFFKIWGMCNNVNRLANHFCKNSSKETVPESQTPTHKPLTPSDYNVERYDPRLNDVKVGDKVRRLSDGKILEVIAVGEEALECKGGMLDGIHAYPKDSLSVI